MSNISEDLLKHLTPERRQAFERSGEMLVEQNIRDGLWQGDGRKAALAWLAIQKQKQDCIETIRFWAIFLVACFTLIAAVIPLLGGK